MEERQVFLNYNKRFFELLLEKDFILFLKESRLASSEVSKKDDSVEQTPEKKQQQKQQADDNRRNSSSSPLSR